MFFRKNSLRGVYFSLAISSMVLQKITPANFLIGRPRGLPIITHVSSSCDGMAHAYLSCMFFLHADAVYRIYLNIQSDCHQWTSTSNMPNKRADITSHIIQGIKDQCNQIQVKDDVIRNDEHAFECPTHPKETVVYNAQVYGNELTNTSILVSCLDKWIKKTQVIVVYEVDLEINKECTSVVDDVNSSLDCGQKPVPTKKPNMSRDKRIAIGVGVSSIFLFFLLIFAVVVICILCVKW